ncbi:type IV secretion system protein virB9 precursor [mine drainage metagenome]|uniref:Type IV secretion system protein virB9 n=1 Tax=mine drainage metagenome TaxID=410659 RepID=A0A1J5P4M3_9ZZZZ
MSKTTTIATMLLAASCSASYAERAPNSLGADARIRSVLYNPVDVIRLDTNLRVNTAVELGDGEQITSVLLGDSKAYTVEVLSNKSTISIKPVVAGAWAGAGSSVR